MATVFTIARNRNAAVAQAVLGTQDGSIAVTDRLGSYDWIAGSHRQICWSHLRRDFQAMIDRGGAAEPIGPAAVEAVGPAVPVVASTRGRPGGPRAIPSGDGPAAARGQGRPGRGHAVWLQDDQRELRRDPAGGTDPVDLRAQRWCPADEQRGGACFAALLTPLGGLLHFHHD
jgi:Transposase IS66 family